MEQDSRRLQYIVINLDFTLTAKGRNGCELSVKAHYIIDFQY
jgi:hypothetical protein